jgi:methionine-gamma-lyase
MERQQASAIKVASWLRNHADVQRLLTAQSEDLSPADAAIMEEQTTGRGAMIAFEVAGGREAAFHVLDALKHFKLAVSLGSTESLAEHPASMTHAGVPLETKSAYGITEGLVRLSIGIEHPDDLIADLDHALKSLVQQEKLDAF